MLPAGRRLKCAWRSAFILSAISYGNTIKKAADIAYAFRRGIRKFAFDSEGELRKLAEKMRRVVRSCAGSRPAARTQDGHSPKKFGCDLEMAADLLLMSRDLGSASSRFGFSCRFAANRSNAVANAFASDRRPFSQACSSRHHARYGEYWRRFSCALQE